MSTEINRTNEELMNIDNALESSEATNNEEATNDEEVTLTGRIAGRVKPETETEYIKVFKDLYKSTGVSDKITHDEKMKLMIDALKSQIAEQQLKSDNIEVEKFNLDLSNELSVLEESHKHMMKVFETVQNKANSIVAQHRYELSVGALQKSRTIESNALKVVTDAQAEMNLLLNENNDLRASLENSNETINALEEEKNMLFSVNDKLGKEIQKLQSELEKYKKKDMANIEKLEKMNSKVNELLDENRTIRKDYEVATNQLNSYKSEIATTVETLRFNEVSLKKDIEVANNQIANLGKELENVKKERDSINIEYQVLKRELDLNK